MVSAVFLPAPITVVLSSSLSNEFRHHKGISFTFSLSHCNFSKGLTKRATRFCTRCSVESEFKDQIVNDLSLNWEDVDKEQQATENEELGLASPWEGAIVYRRNPSITHLEYCTTLERLGLGNLSTQVSKSRASVMGLRVTKAVKDYPLGTPVQLSIDITRKKKRLRLDGIIKTVITLTCNRCCQPAAECVYSNFSLLLKEEPFEEPKTINMGMMFREDKFKSSASKTKEEEDDGDEASIDMDDWLYFPPEEREIDISKHVRDLVHVEITINAVCDPRCKGVCLKCGADLNKASCNCNKERTKEENYGPLKDLREKMQAKA
uniref:Uncharacterized protein MANES_09G055500 n=2 Tax=Rhizophora mucronata TaxID=61149 RepID=A0A2P2IR13_RHIMU